MAESSDIDPMKEVIAETYVDRDPERNEAKKDQPLVEMYLSLPEEYHCILVPTLVDANNNTTVKVYI